MIGVFDQSIIQHIGYYNHENFCYFGIFDQFNKYYIIDIFLFYCINFNLNIIHLFTTAHFYSFVLFVCVNEHDRLFQLDIPSYHYLTNDY